MDLLEAHRVRLIGGGPFGPEGLADLQGLVEQLASPSILDPIRFVFLSLPTDADTDVESPLGKQLDSLVAGSPQHDRLLPQERLEVGDDNGEAW